MRSLRHYNTTRARVCRTIDQRKSVQILFRFTVQCYSIDLLATVVWNEGAQANLDQIEAADHNQIVVISTLGTD